MPDPALLALALGIGFVAGLRSLTAPAAVSWAAHLGSLDLRDSPLSFIGSTLAVLILSTLAIVEYVMDLLPTTPRRTLPGPLIGRVLLGGLAGACLSISAGRSILLGTILGGLGAVIGTFAGYHARTHLVRVLNAKDSVIALSEDLVAIFLAWLIVSPH